VTTPPPAHRSFHAMAKPAGSTCNLDCTYCFYLSKETLVGGPGTGQMDDAVLENFIVSYIGGNTGPNVVFSWQGGEPTLRGLDFYRKVVELQKKHARPGQRIGNDLQTNGVLLDDEWAQFLRQNDFLVGLSIDGPRELHDRYRISKGGAPTFDRVLAAAKLLKRTGVQFNTLTCINRHNASRPLDVYRFLRREIESTHIQFIPIVQARGFESGTPFNPNPHGRPVAGTPEAGPGHPDSIVTDWSVDPEEWGYFLCKVFDEWIRRDLGKVMVNHFETLVAQHMGLPSQICIYSKKCGTAVAVEHDGSVYSCDHFVYPEYRLGNLRQTLLGDMVFSPRQKAFGSDKSDKLPAYCRRCEFLTDCWGECPKNRLVLTPDGEPGLNYLCAGFKTFFAHAIPEIDRIVKSLQQSRPRPMMARI